MVGMLVGADEAELRRRADDLMALLGEGAAGGRSGAGASAEAWIEDRRPRWVLGTPDEARAQVGRLRGGRASSGSCSRTLLPWDLDMVDLVGPGDASAASDPHRGRREAVDASALGSVGGGAVGEGRRGGSGRGSSRGRGPVAR